MRLTFRSIICEILTVMFAILGATSASVLRAVLLTGLVVRLVREGISVAAESLPNDATAIVVHVLCGVLATSRGDTLRIVSAWLRIADLAARVFVPRLAIVWSRIAGHL